VLPLAESGASENKNSINIDEEEEILETEVNMFCLLRSSEQRKTQWDLLVMILAVWNVFTIPIEVAFMPEVILCLIR
jgi:hypothetical protein